MKKKFNVQEAYADQRKIKSNKIIERFVDFVGDPKVKPISLFYLFKYASRKDLFMVLLGTVCSFVSGLCVPLMLMFFSQSTGAIINFATATQKGANITQEIHVLTVTLYDTIQKTGFLGAFSFISNYFSVVFFAYSCANQIQRIRCLYLEKVLNQDIAWFDINGNANFTTRMTEDLSKIEEVLGEQTSSIIFYLSVFISGSFLAIIKGWELALICLIYLPVSIVSLQLISWLSTKLINNEFDAYAEAGAIVEEVVSSIRTVIAFGGQQEESKRYKDQLLVARTNNINKALIQATSTGLMWCTLYISYALSFYYGVSLVIEERDLPEEEQVYTVKNMLTIFFAAVYATWDFAYCVPYFQIIVNACKAATKIYAIIDNQPKINMSIGSGKRPTKLIGDIVFKNVKFSYPSRKDIQVLKKVSVNITAGETIAFVGSSGCGKSTCIQLLQRFYDPTSGSILIDGTNIKDYDLKWLRSSIGVVGQEPVLFSGTIAENIRLGYPQATETDVENAAMKANAHSFIMKLPKGYDTLIGERGAQLSGGQKQRLAIARALLRNPSILLLDEATSALDTTSEKQVQNAVEAAIKKECTTIIVAHRLSTIRNANRILVFDNGRIVEEGNHKSLMSKKGIYFDLVTAQISYLMDYTFDQDTFDNKIIEEDIEENLQEKADDEHLNFKDIKHTSKSPLWTILKLNKPEIIQICTGSVCSIIFGATLPFYSFIFGDIISILSHPDSDYIWNETVILCYYFLIIGVISGLAAFFQWYLFGISGEKLTMRVRYLLFKNILKQEISWFDKKENGVGAISAKLSTDTIIIQSATGQPIGTVLNSVAAMFIAIIMSLYYEWRLSLVTLSVIIVIPIAMYMQSNKIADACETHSLLSKSAKVAVEAISNIRTVYSLGCENILHEKFIELLRPHYQTVKKSSHFTAVVFSLARILMFICYAISIFYGGFLIVEHGVSHKNIFKITESLICGAWYIGYALAFTPNIQKGFSACRSVAHLLQRTPLIKDNENASAFGWGNGNIRYSKINFHYPSRSKINILSELDLSIVQGKTVGLVGSSGCGKSTIIQLLQRFYDPLSGSITVDSNGITSMKLAALRSHIGLVSQEPNLFNRTIGENIAYGDNYKIVSKQHIISAARKANIHDFICSLPLGYDTKVGGNGTLISGGQKQRIAIARALIRDPQVLVLDEATSALDSESEKVVQEAIETARKGRTCISIAHRLSTLQHSDLICVLDKGQIKEMGTHLELLKFKGIYYSLYKMQVLGI